MENVGVISKLNIIFYNVKIGGVGHRKMGISERKCIKWEQFGCQ